MPATVLMARDFAQDLTSAESVANPHLSLISSGSVNGLFGKVGRGSAGRPPVGPPFLIEKRATGCRYLIRCPTVYTWLRYSRLNRSTSFGEDSSRIFRCASSSNKFQVCSSSISKVMLSSEGLNSITSVGPVFSNMSVNGSYHSS